MANTTAYTQLDGQTGDGAYSIEISSTGYVYPQLIEPEPEDMIYAKSFETVLTLGRITTPRTSILEIPILQDGSISTFQILGEPGSGDITFNIRKNGVNLYSGGTRPVLNNSSPEADSGQLYVEKTAVGEDVVFGDKITLDINTITGTGLFPTFTFVVTVEPS